VALVVKGLSESQVATYDNELSWLFYGTEFVYNRMAFAQSLDPAISTKLLLEVINSEVK